MKQLKSILFGLLLIGSAVATHAQDNGTLDIRTIVQKEETFVADDGSEETRLVVADMVIPGDEVVYTLTYANGNTHVIDHEAHGFDRKESIIGSPLPIIFPERQK